MDYQQNNYPGVNNPAPPPPQQQLEPHRGTMVLVFGIVGLVACGIFALLAWIFGTEDLKKMNQGIMDPSGMANTNTGKILGIIGTSFWILGIVIWLMIAVVGIASY